MTNVKLSIITINYNNASGLEKTIKSVVNQSFSDFEFIIIDGNSTDKSKEVINNHNSNIDFWVSENDSGVFNAMNKGIEKSNGEYLLFLNSGDFLNGNDVLKTFISHKNFTGDIIYGDYKFEKGEKIYPDKLTPYFFIKTSLPHQSTFFKRSVFNTMGMYDETFSIASDRAFYIKCFLSGKIKFQHINIALTQYDLTGLSNNMEQRSKKIEEDEVIFKKYLGIYYEDYKSMLNYEKKISELKRNTPSGIIKRLKKRLNL